MNSEQFRRAFKLADSAADLSEFSTEQFNGFGLPDFKPVTVRVGDVARLLRWQGQYLFGGWDMEAVNEVRVCGRRSFVVVD